MSGGFVVALVGSLAVRRAPYLEGKLMALRRQLLLQAGMLGVFVVGVFGAAQHSGYGLGTLPADDAATNVRVDTLAWTFQQHLREGNGRIACLALLLLFAGPSVLHVLRELQTFVLNHRTDLLARDQAGGAVDRAGKA
ncbi:MAG: hypothetical protein KF830_01530 [Planctomycetes bacterium]|nr:hypothetical protein [Planctomycetota bacterium]